MGSDSLFNGASIDIKQELRELKEPPHPTSFAYVAGRVESTAEGDNRCWPNLLDGDRHFVKMGQLYSQALFFEMLQIDGYVRISYINEAASKIHCAYDPVSCVFTIVAIEILFFDEVTNERRKEIAQELYHDDSTLVHYCRELNTIAILDPQVLEAEVVDSFIFKLKPLVQSGD